MSPSRQKVWHLETPDHRQIDTLRRALNIDRLTARILVNRGIKTVDEASRFLNPSFDHLHDPFLMAGMEEAVLRIRSALQQGEHILIFGDDDVDGITSTTLIYQFLKSIGADVRYFIPRRFEHGHGFNPKSLEAALAPRRPDLVITADCGVSSVKEISHLHSLGIESIVVDHHSLPDDGLPPGIILNPRMPDSRFPFIDLAAVGVAFNLVYGIFNHFKELGVWPDGRAPNLVDYLDLVSLGTVADVVPLVDENRVFVHLGLEVLRKRRRCGVAALLEKVNGDNARVSERTICYRLAPRLNAAGRVGDANECVDLLSVDRYGSAQSLVGNLEGYNEKRQETEAGILEEAMAIAQEQVDMGRRILVVAKDGWHQGVLGIVASRLLERFHRPTLLIAMNNGRARGSARSPAEVNILECMRQCDEVLEDWGGHSAAAGLTLKAENVPKLYDRMEAVADDVLHEGKLPAPTLHIDGEVKLHDLSAARIRDIERLAPFGSANPEPSFLIRDVRSLKSRVVGRNHLRVRLRADRSVVDVIGFSMGDSNIPSNRPMDVVLTPRTVTKTGPDVELQLLAVDSE